MAIDPRISMAVQQASVLPAINTFMQVREQQRQMALDPLRKQAMQQQVQQGEQTLDMNAAKLEAFKDKRALTSLGNFALSNQAVLERVKQGDANSQTQLFEALRQRKEQLELQNLPTAQTDEALQLIGADRAGDVATALLNAPAMAGLTKPTVQGTASQRDFETFKELEAKALETGLDSDKQAANQFGRQAGFVRPTEQEKADIKVDEAARKELEKLTIQRKQGYIDTAIDAADSVGNLKRSLALLNEVKTGGFDGLSIRAKQFFGVEGADEGELSANLGKAVLAQLKPIFGAAFTAAEGERLERIEARLGANTETNKRLLAQTLKVAERAANRGLAAAEEAGDNFTAEEIRKSLATEISLPEVGQQTNDLSVDDLVKKYGN